MLALNQDFVVAALRSQILDEGEVGITGSAISYASQRLQSTENFLTLIVLGGKSTLIVLWGEADLPQAGLSSVFKSYQ